MLCKRVSQSAMGSKPLLISPIILFCVTCVGQASSALYQGISMPPQTLPAGRQDATALQQVQAYRQVVGADLWTGMRGQGAITPNAPDSSGKPTAPQAATLWMNGGQEFRLDIQKPAGTNSLRMQAAYGATQHEDGQTQPMDLSNAVIGLFAFPRLLTNGFPSPNVSLIDQGKVTVGGVSLHRISMGIPWPNAPSASQTHAPTVIDLYFDLGSNLLVKSAAFVADSSSDPSRYLQVISYGDYQVSGRLTLPYLYSEQLNGQLLWTLQLNSIQLQNSLADSVFTF